MSTAPKKTTLTLDDIQMIGEVVFDSEKRLDKKITALQQEIGGMKQEISGIKQEIGGMKQEISGIKQEMVRKDEYVSLIKSAVTEVIEEKIKEIVGQFPNKHQFHAQMAAQATTVQKVDQEQIVLTYQVQNIDKRVGILENKAFT